MKIRMIKELYGYPIPPGECRTSNDRAFHLIMNGYAEPVEPVSDGFKDRLSKAMGEVEQDAQPPSLPVPENDLKPVEKRKKAVNPKAAKRKKRKTKVKKNEI